MFMWSGAGMDFFQTMGITCVQVSGPFFVPLLGSFQDDECVYLVLEYVAGGELFTYLQRNGRWAASPASCANPTCPADCSQPCAVPSSVQDTE